MLAPRTGLADLQNARLHGRCEVALLDAGHTGHHLNRSPLTDLPLTVGDGGHQHLKVPVAENFS